MSLISIERLLRTKSRPALRCMRWANQPQHIRTSTQWWSTNTSGNQWSSESCKRIFKSNTYMRKHTSWRIIQSKWTEHPLFALKVFWKQLRQMEDVFVHQICTITVKLLLIPAWGVESLKLGLNQSVAVHWEWASSKGAMRTTPLPRRIFRRKTSSSLDLRKKSDRLYHMRKYRKSKHCHHLRKNQTNNLVMCILLGMKTWHSFLTSLTGMWWVVWCLAKKQR